MAEIPKGTTGTKEVKHDESKGEEDPGKHFEEGTIGRAGLKSQGYRIFDQSSSGFKEKHKFKLEGKRQSARKTKEQEEEKYKVPFALSRSLMSSSSDSEVEYHALKGSKHMILSAGYRSRQDGPITEFTMTEFLKGTTGTKKGKQDKSKEVKPQSARITKEQEEEKLKSLLTCLKHGRRISNEIDDLSLLVTKEILPDQLHSLMEKLIEEQKQLGNLHQEMATSVKQRATDSQLDLSTSEDSSELDVLLSKIHLVSLKLNLQRMKSVDEAQVKTDTKVSEKQHHDMKKAHSTLQTALKELGKAMKSGDTFRVSHLEKYDTQRCMTVSVYCQQMLVDDLQALVPQTILVKEPVYHKQYMENLNVLIKTQQQLVQNLTDLQKQKKGSKLEKESPKQDYLPAGEVGKQQLNELELITEQTGLINDCLHWVHLHKYCYSHEAFFVICFLQMVNSGHDWSVMETWIDVMKRHVSDMSMVYGRNGELFFNEQIIMDSQRSFLEKVWNERQASEERKHMIFSAGYQSLQDDPPEEPELEVIHSRIGEMSVSDKEDEKTSIEPRETAENTLVSDGIDKSVDEDSNLSAAGYTSTIQTTQAVYLMTPRNDEQAVKETPSHLKEVLNELNKQTAGISDFEKTCILLQLPYMAVGFFNNNGGILALEKYDVHLYIPPGAIAEGRTQQVYIYVNPDGTVADTVDGEEEQLSPEIYCGPPGLTFEDSLVLSFPHHAESSDWEFTAKMSSASSAAWQALISSTDGQLVSAKGNKAIFRINHFSWFSLFGIPWGTSRKRVRIGAFGDTFGPRCYAFRVYIWKDNKVSQQKVVEFEEKKGSEILDAFRDLKFLKGKGNMRVEMKETIKGWNVRPQTTQIDAQDVWSLSQNSVSFNVSISRSNDADDIPHVNCYQQQENSDGQERKTELCVVPSQILMRDNNLNQIHAVHMPQDAPNITPAECHTDGSGGITMQRSMTYVRSAISSVVERSKSVKMYGDLSDQEVNELCEFLDKQGVDDRCLLLRVYLSGNGSLPPRKADKEVLEAFFSQCSKHNIPDQDAVQYLKGVFREINYTRAVEIIESGKERVHAEAQPILEFADNDSLTEIDAEICFKDIAKKLGPDWKDLATNLGINNNELTAMIKKSAGSSDQMFDMLMRWQQGCESFGKDAFSTLLSSLEKIERNDLVELLKGKVTNILFFKRQVNKQL